MSTKDNLLFLGTGQDKEYLHFLKGSVKGATCFVKLDKIGTNMEVQMYCDKRDIKGIISTSVPFLKKLLNWTEKKAPSLAQYSGSVFTIPNTDIEVVFVNPLKHCITVKYGKFLLQRYVNKLVAKDKWFPHVPHTWNVAEPSTMEEDFERLQAALLIGVDIETFKEHARIRCISFCGIYSNNDGTLCAHSTVIPLDSSYALTWLRKFCWELKAPKVFQNGKYDINYLLRYNTPVYNYLLDTANLMHSWYSELPKDLGNLASFFVRDSMFWKDMADTTDLYEYYHYNALDTYQTAVAAIAMLLEMPKWALTNYYLEFPTVFPCILAEMTGIKRDMNKLEKAREEQDAKDLKATTSLGKIVGDANFNPGSPKQCLQLLHILGCKDFKSADEKHLIKAKFRHPFNGRVVGLVLEAREARTLKSKYLQVGESAKEFKGRILYALNPHGTDTSRLASKEHHFWTGLQIQNIPRGKEVKQTLVADPDFYFAEADLEQAESRDTAYLSGDKALIQAVEGDRDFHSVNCSAFFGVPYEKIFDDETRKTLNKKLRDLAKRTNHGANYNMGAYMLLETMGEQKVLEAKRLLGLPKVWSLKEVTEYLLEQFHKTYPGIRSTMYKGVIAEITSTKRISSKAYHWSEEEISNGKPLVEYADLTDIQAWTRYCFGDPTKNKLILNSYVAHPPQSLNAQTLNKAWIRVFFNIAINPKYARHFKLIAQVHDSILFQYRKGHEYLCDMVKDLMEIPVTIRGYDGVVRTFTVPAEVKLGKLDDNGNLIPAKYWSETE